MPGAPSDPGDWQQQRTSFDSLVLIRLAPGLPHEIQLSSTCAVNESTPRDTLPVVLDCIQPNIWAYNEGVSTANITNTSQLVTVGSNWFEYRKYGDTTWIATRPGPIYDIGLSGLDDLTVYEARSYSTCPNGDTSRASLVTRFTTEVDCRTPTNLGVVAAQPNVVEIRWDVTGTITRWEVFVKEKNAMNQQASQMANQGFTMSDGSTPSGSSPSSSAPAAAQNNYMGNAWRRYLTTEPRLTLAGLPPDMGYAFVVRATCPTFGWTDFSPELHTRVLPVRQPHPAAWILILIALPRLPRP